MNIPEDTRMLLVSLLIDVFFFLIYFCPLQATTGSMHLDNETFTKSSTNNGEEKASDIKYSSHSLEEVAPMVHGTISAYEAKVHNKYGPSNSCCFLSI